MSIALKVDLLPGHIHLILVATSVVGITDFANSAVDLAEKVGIEIQILPTPALPKSSAQNP